MEPRRDDEPTSTTTADEVDSDLSLLVAITVSIAVLAALVTVLPAWVAVVVVTTVVGTAALKLTSPEVPMPARVRVPARMRHH